MISGHTNEEGRLSFRDWASRKSTMLDNKKPEEKEQQTETQKEELRKLRRNSALDVKEEEVESEKIREEFDEEFSLR